MSYQEKTRFHGKWAKMKELADTSTRGIAAQTKKFHLGLIATDFTETRKIPGIPLLLVRDWPTIDLDALWYQMILDLESGET